MYVPIILPPIHTIENFCDDKNLAKIESRKPKAKSASGRREAPAMMFSGVSRALHLAVKRSCPMRPGSRARFLETRWLVESW